MIVFCGLALFGLGMAGGFVLGGVYNQQDKDEPIPGSGWPPPLGDKKLRGIIARCNTLAHDGAARGCRYCDEVAAIIQSEPERR